MIYTILILIPVFGIIISLYLLKPNLMLRPFIGATVINAIIFLTIDTFLTGKSWYFNQGYILGFYLINLPIEEVLFFLVIPPIVYILSLYLPSHISYRYINIGIVLVAILILSSAKSGIYTDLMIILSIIGLVYYIIFGDMEIDRAVVLSYLLFLPYNYILTSVPVVVYIPEGFSNIRFITIPVEDFLFNFIMMLGFVGGFKIARELSKMCSPIQILSDLKRRLSL
ncbi:MAG: lycopene cyclase domain-containing protein [Candidatus Anstonellales archaeon]